MAPRRHEPLTIPGHALAEAVAPHERHERAALDALRRAEHILPLPGWAADRIEAWARAGGGS